MNGILSITCTFNAFAIFWVITVAPAPVSKIIGANQVATGLALTIFASGLSAFVGADYVGKTITGLQQMNKSIPLLNQDIVVYLSIILVILVSWFLRKTRSGLVLRSVGESPEAADALGLPVVRVRYFAVMFGGAMAFFSAFVISRLRIRRCGRKI